MRDLKGPIYQTWRSLVNAKKSLEVQKLVFNAVLSEALQRDVDRYEKELDEAIKHYLDKGGHIDGIET